MRKGLLIALMAAVVCCFTLAGCGGSGTEASGSGSAASQVTIGNTYVIDKIDPTYSGDPWSLTSDGISETIYMQDENGSLVSHIAEGLEQKDDLTWELTLKDGVKFSNGDPVDAQAISDCMNEIMEKNEMATASAGVIKFEPVDDLVVKMTTERKTTVMDSILCEWTNVIYKKDGDSFVFTGPYTVEKLEGGSSLELTPNEYYDDKAGDRPNVTIKAFKDSASMKQAFEGGEIDMAFTVTPEAARELKDGGKTVKDIDAGYQYFAITRYSEGATKDADVRQAINLAVDRDSMVKALGAGRVANGFFAQYYDFAGEVKESTDKDQAKALLEKAGYKDSDGDGFVDKDGKNLTLKLITYPSRPDLQVLMQQATSDLDEIGVKTKTEIVDNIDEVLASGDYDIAFYAQHTAPTGEPAYSLNQFFRDGQGKNTMGYKNDEVSANLDKMGDLQPGDERNQLAKDVQAQVAEDLPVIYLVDPQWHIAVSDTLADYQPYCGDYYVVNAQLGL